MTLGISSGPEEPPPDDAPAPPFDGLDTAGALALIRGEQAARQVSEVREWQAVVAWAEANLHGVRPADAVGVEASLDTGIRLAGEGAPLVSEFAVVELAAALGRGVASAKNHAGRILECAWRLPRVYAAVVAGRLAPWRAARIADHTAALNAEAAAYVDQRLGSAVATGVVGWKRLGQLVDEAVMRFDPDLAEARRQRAAEARAVHTQSCGEGLAGVEAVLDAADAADLEQAISRQAEALARMGDTSSLTVRRARALGVIARIALCQELLVADPSTGEVTSTDPGRRVTLNVHLTPASLAAGVEGGNPVARWEEGRIPVLIGQVREWLLQPATTIRVQPVIDLAAHHPVEAYEIPDRMRRQVGLRDHTCRFPSCEQPATGCDLDHRVPHADGGITCACNLQPLCRRHHRAKTHAGWQVDLIDDQPGHYRWVSPHGYRFDVHPEGTTDG